MNIKRSDFNKKKILNFGVLLFALFPVLPNKIKGLPIIFLVLVSFIYFKKTKINFRFFLLNASLYIIYLLAFFFSNHKGAIGILLETSLSVLCLPLVFNVLISHVRFDKRVRLKFYKLFITSTFIFSILILFNIFIDDTTIYYSNWYTNKARTIIENSRFIGQHPIYASVFFGISILFAVDILKNTENKISNKAFYYSAILFNFFLLLFFLSKGVLLALLITLFAVFFMNTKWTKKRIAFLLVSIFLISCLFTFNRRMNELINIDTYKSVNTNYSTGLRVGIYKCVYGLAKDNWILGYGPGNTQEVLNDCYASNSPVLLEKTYNSHNQYLDVLLKTGIFGLLVFLSFLIINYVKAKKNKNFIVTYILIFYYIIFLIENILLRQSGVILFYFFITFFNKVDSLKHNGNATAKHL
mgnify:FL=1|jgi:O-antigen ligase|tara:strand:+ start:4871 stop:6109 length:1239 start_codon:yes stop_codon:yes gene_type:complete